MKLLGVEKSGPLVHKDYLHVGDDGKDRITTVTQQDAAPVIRDVKKIAQSANSKSDLRYIGSVPVNLINEACRQASVSWGVQPREAFAEIIQAKTDRSKKLWLTLTEGRDFRKLQAKHYEP
jgi:hypothetical protein